MMGRVAPIFVKRAKKGPVGLTGRAMEVWERMPERHDLFVPSRKIVQVRNRHFQLQSLQLLGNVLHKLLVISNLITAQLDAKSSHF